MDTKKPGRLSPEFLARLKAENGGRTGWEGPDARMRALWTAAGVLAAIGWAALCWHFEALRLVTLCALIGVAGWVALRTLEND